MTEGDLVWYRQTSYGGYGFTRRVPAIFVRATARRVVVEVLLRDGTKTNIAVHPDRVSPRATGDTIEWAR
jgi:hypothetical protein